MAETIDKVQLEVTATANGATQVVNNLVSSLKTLQSALSSLDTSKLTKATQSVNKTSVNTSGMSKAEKDISSSVNKIKQALAGLESYKNAALSGDSSSLTSFNRRVISIQSSIDTLKEKFSQLGNTSVPTTAFSNLDTQIEATKSKLEELKAKEESMSSSGTSVGDMTSVQTDIQNTEAELEKLIAKQQDLINSGQAYTDPLASYRDSIDEVQQSLSNAKSEVDAFSNSQPSVDLSGLSSGLSDVSDKAKDAASQLWSMTKSGIKSGFSSLKSSLSKIKDTLTSIGTKASNTASTGFSKILKYGFGIRSMYVLFRRLRTAVKDSFTELQNSGAYYQTTKANVEALKNSLTTLKYQFGAAFEPIFNTVAPALQTLINYLVTVMNTISAFIAKLTGKSTYSKAVVATSEIASNTGSAAGSAAELNKQLQGFDELNNLDLDSGSSGGSGSSGSSDSSDVTYVEESVDSALTSFWNSLSDAITSGNWYEAGTLISDALTDALNSINWDSIFEGAADFGTNLADFLNGLITDDLFSALGTTIANAIKTALIAAISFGEEFDWTGLGTAIASGINAFVEANPLSLLVTAFNTWANGILTTLIAAVQGVKWSDIAQNIADAIGNVDMTGIAWNLGTLVSSLVNAFYTLVSNKDTWTNLGTKIGDGITNFFASMNAVDSSTGLTGWQALGSSITSVISGIITTLKTALNNTNWEEVGQAIADFIGSIDFASLAWDLIGLASALFRALKDAIESLWNNADTATKIGAAIVGLIAVANLSGLTSTLVSLIAGAIPSTISLSSPLNLSFLGKIAILAGTAALAWEGGKTLSQWIAEKLSGTQGISAEATNDYIKVSQSMTLETVVEEITTAANETTNDGTNRLWDSWSNMVNDWYEPVYDIIDDEIDKNKNKTSQKDANGREIETGTDWSDYTTNSSSSKTGYKSTRTFTTKLNTELTGEAKNSSALTNLKTLFDNLTESSSKNTEAEYETKVGGQINSIDDLTTWKTKFTNLRNQWNGKTATLKAEEDGLGNNKVNSWVQKLQNFATTWGNIKPVSKFGTSEEGLGNNKVSGWVQKLTNFANTWNNTKPTSTFTTKESGINDFEKSGGLIEKLKNIQSIWQGNGVNRTATFTTSSAGNLGSASSMNEYASASQNIYDHFHGGSYSAGYSVSYSGMSEGEINNYAAASGNLWNNWHSGAYSTSYSVSGSVDTSSLDNFSSILADKIKKAAKKVSLSVNVTAKGGIISASGALSNIPQFAGGTLNAGSVFVAGERGPEVMGHINGRTEILNRSQMASIMNNSFVNAMAQFGNRMLTSPETVAYKASGYQSYNPGSNSSNDNLLLAEQNQLLREQNELLSQLLDKPTGVSSRDVFNAVRSESSSYYNRTGNSPFLF